jgi:hypothetical protein
VDVVGSAVDGTKVGLVLALGVEGEVVVGNTLGIMLGELVAVDIVTLRIRLLYSSAMYTLPDESTFTPAG